VVQLLGWAGRSRCRRTRRCSAAIAVSLGRHRLLLQFDGWDRYPFNDNGGPLMIKAPSGDLVAGRFDRLCAEIQND
jgi:hypothetical protein